MIGAQQHLAIDLANTPKPTASKWFANSVVVILNAQNSNRHNEKEFSGGKSTSCAINKPPIDSRRSCEPLPSHQGLLASNPHSKCDSYIVSVALDGSLLKSEASGGLAVSEVLRGHQGRARLLANGSNVLVLVKNLSQLTPAIDMLQAAVLCRNLAAEMMAFTQVNDLQSESLGDFAASLAECTREARERMAAIVCCVALLPLSDAALQRLVGPGGPRGLRRHAHAAGLLRNALPAAGPHRRRPTEFFTPSGQHLAGLGSLLWEHTGPNWAKSSAGPRNLPRPLAGGRHEPTGHLPRYLHGYSPAHQRISDCLETSGVCHEWR